MEIRYCCETMESILSSNQDNFEDTKQMRKFIFEDGIEYCPYCGAKITHTKLYPDKNKDEYDYHEGEM